MKKGIGRWIALAAIAAPLILCGCGGSGSATDAAGKSSSKVSPNAGKPNEPVVTFPELQGGELSLASLKGKVVLVNFWATWCEPCREEIPWLIAFQQKYADQGFTILGAAIDVEGKPVVAPWVQKTEFNVDGKQMTMSYPIVLANLDIQQKFGGLIGYPTSILISRDGKMVNRFIGEIDRGVLQKDIEKQLAYQP